MSYAFPNSAMQETGKRNTTTPRRLPRLAIFSPITNLAKHVLEEDVLMMLTY